MATLTELKRKCPAFESACPYKAAAQSKPILDLTLKCPGFKDGASTRSHAFAILR
jgi:hypothetical protein